MTRLFTYGHCGAWAIGCCLIVSVSLRPEMAMQATSYLADLFSGEPWSALEALMWVLMAAAGLGFLALRRWACFLVYVAFVYSFPPFRLEFPVCPVTPLVTRWIDVASTVGNFAVHFLNGLFVLFVVGVHVVLARTAPVPRSRRADRILLAVSATTLALLVVAVTVAFLIARRLAVPNSSFQPTRATVYVFTVLIGVPIATWGIPSLVLASVRLWRHRRARHAIEAIGNVTLCDAVAGATATDSPVRATQFTLRSLCIAVVYVSVLAALGASIWRNAHDVKRYQRRFDAVTALADRIVVRDGGYDCCIPTEGQRTIFEITDQQEIADVRKHIQLVPEVPSNLCMCCGYPGIDWYRGTRRLALTSVQHGHSIRWSGFPLDAELTKESSAWLVVWLQSNGVKMEEVVSPSAIEPLARPILDPYVSSRYRQALGQAPADATRDGASQETRLRNDRIRSAFEDEHAMYAALFRVLGCLTMRWDCWYEPEQGAAFDFLTRAPREELEQAISRAARSTDRIERQGAARMVFSQFFMVDHGKTPRDIARWMAILSDVAYADPLPENRRLVLERLTQYRVTQLDLLVRALGDPDQTVRRKAIKALAADGSETAVAALQRVKGGEIQPGDATPRVTDYSPESPNVLNIPEMKEEEVSESDARAASAALKEIAARQSEVGR